MAAERQLTVRLREYQGDVRMGSKARITAVQRQGQVHASNYRSASGWAGLDQRRLLTMDLNCDLLQLERPGCRGGMFAFKESIGG
jgi:hypothetical protein